MTITRSRPVDTPWYNKYYLNGGLYAQNLNVLTMPSSTTGTNVGGYRKLIADGSNAVGNYDADRSKVGILKPGSFSASGSAMVGQGSRTELVTGFATSLSAPFPLSPSQSKADSMALSKVLRKIKQEQEHLNLLASLAEIGDVIRQFGAPAQALVDLSNKRLNRLELERRGLKGTTVFKRAKWHRIVASTWLEYAFGLAPLISDTRKVAEALAHFNNDKELSGLTSKAKVSARAEDVAESTTVTPNVVYSDSHIYVTRTQYDKSVARCQYVVGLKAVRTADFGSNQRLLDLLGVNQANLLGAAWEALPWSWLADYFSNIGNILEACATSTASVSWICKTQSSVHTRNIKTVLDFARTAQGFSLVGMNLLNASGAAEYEGVRTVLSRRSPTTLGLPALYFEYPTQNGQLANMVAVLFARKEKSSALWLF